MSLLLSDADVRQAMSYPDLADCIEAALKVQTAETAVVPARMNLEYLGTWLRVMPAYSFTNHSHDIRSLFMATCARLGLRAREANAVTISIARRGDVARLDQWFGYAPESAAQLLPAVEGGDRAAEEKVGDAEDLVGDGFQGAAGAPPVASTAATRFRSRAAA